MKSFGTWFRDFFLYSLPLGEEQEGNFSQYKGEDLVELKKLSVKLSWLFGTVLYLSGAAFCFWILALSTMHLTVSLKEAHILEKIFFFASPNTWKKYFFASGGLFNAFRFSKDRVEYAFIFFTLGLISCSLLSLVFSLITINISLKHNLKELRLVSFPLCFPVFGWLFGFVLILHFFLVGSKERVKQWAKRKKLWALLFNRYFNFLEKKEEIKHQFKPKKLNFLDAKKKEGKLPKFLGETDRYIVKKI